MLTFTPLMGMSETVMQFLPGGQIQESTEGSKFVVMATWDDAPHLSQAVKDELWKAIPPFQRDARSKGIPQLGAPALFTQFQSLTLSSMTSRSLSTGQGFTAWTLVGTGQQSLGAHGTERATRIISTLSTTADKQNPRFTPKQSVRAALGFQARLTSLARSHAKRRSPAPSRLHRPRSEP
jgi:hypothetical protein